ncbi:Peptidyl-prolyl cis-trans isomerase PpiA precursor [Enhygromyxa salina]|uniref:Peptidyl-prolyl cis-trans isomerase n=1 Tax=Enhygromyxa salina TaxID=215803 RepID=A0A0C2DAN8_9BACT|nr:Peptidyl-prolyl cis-trans isomerase PpiA precursor [Enhygromyxa salina]
MLCAGCGSDPAGESGETGSSSESGTDTDTTETSDTFATFTTNATLTDTDTDTGTDTDGEACLVDEPIVVLETSLGTMVVQLDRTRAPITVENFVGYVSDGFYDGTIFHRVINGFVIQGGGYTPGLGVKTTKGPIPLEIHPELNHVDGAIAMARSNEPDTAESQWYITDGPQPGLDGQYAVFGALIDGFAVRDAIAGVPVQTVPFMDFEFMNVPVEDVLVNAAYCVDAWP